MLETLRWNPSQRKGSQPREPTGKGRPNHHLLPRGTLTQVFGPLHSGRLIKTAETHRPPSRPCPGTCRPQWRRWKSMPAHPPALSSRSLGAKSLARARVLEQPISREGGMVKSQRCPEPCNDQRKLVAWAGCRLASAKVGTDP